MKINKVVVIGSGTMGSGIAAQLCNANVPVTLLDLTTEISEKARERILKSRPPLLIDKSKINNINVGNINDNFNDSYIKSLFSLLIATSIIFIFGVGYLGSVIGYEKALAGGLYPFLPSELFKIALAVAIIPSITKIIK